MTEAKRIPILTNVSVVYLKNYLKNSVVFGQPPCYDLLNFINQ